MLLLNSHATTVFFPVDVARPSNTVTGSPKTYCAPGATPETTYVVGVTGAYGFYSPCEVFDSYNEASFTAWELAVDLADQGAQHQAAKVQVRNGLGMIVDQAKLLEETDFDEFAIIMDFFGRDGITPQELAERERVEYNKLTEIELEELDVDDFDVDAELSPLAQLKTKLGR